MNWKNHIKLIDDYNEAFDSFEDNVSYQFADKFARLYFATHKYIINYPTLSTKLSAHHYFWQYDSISEIRIKPIGFPYDHSLYNVIDQQNYTNHILALLSDRQDYFETVSSLEYREQTKNTI
jgi:hypothetical protein